MVYRCSSFNRYLSTGKWITSHRFSVCVHVCVYLSVCVPLSLLLFNRYRSTSTGNESHLTASQYVYVCVSICLCVYLFLSFFSTDIDLPPQEMNHISYLVSVWACVCVFTSFSPFQPIQFIALFNFRYYVSDVYLVKFGCFSTRVLFDIILK